MTQELNRTIAVTKTQLEIAQAHISAAIGDLRVHLDQIVDMREKNEVVSIEYALKFSQHATMLVSLIDREHSYRRILERSMR